MVLKTLKETKGEEIKQRIIRDVKKIPAGETEQIPMTVQKNSYLPEYLDNQPES